MAWSEWVSMDEAHARASGRRGYNKRRRDHAQARREEVRQLLDRWGTSAPAKVKIALVLGVSTATVNRDVRALAERPALPLICPTCGLPSRLDIDPSSVTDNPDELARLEQAMARLIGMGDPEAPPPRRTGSRAPRLTRPQGDDRSVARGRPLGQTAAHV
jgi:hypothetical protein